jgi:hypothetical protein
MRFKLNVDANELLENTTNINKNCAKNTFPSLNKYEVYLLAETSFERLTEYS